MNQQLRDAGMESIDPVDVVRREEKIAFCNRLLGFLSEEDANMLLDHFAGGWDKFDADAMKRGLLPPNEKIADLLELLATRVRGIGCP